LVSASINNCYCIAAAYLSAHHKELINDLIKRSRELPIGL
jgi:hypothetical protein